MFIRDSHRPTCGCPYARCTCDQDETKRPIGESGNDGTSPATHVVAMWLGDNLYSQTARRYARAGLAPLRRYAQELLYATPSRHQSLAGVRDSFTSEEFDAIDWAYVRESLQAE